MRAASNRKRARIYPQETKPGGRANGRLCPPLYAIRSTDQLRKLLDHRKDQLQPKIVLGWTSGWVRILPKPSPRQGLPHGHQQNPAAELLPRTLE